MATKKTDQFRAPRPVIRVTQDAIDHALKKNSSHCMIADSIRAQVPNASHVSVDLQTIRFSDPKRGLRFTYLTPRIAQQALAMWDLGMKVKPFTLRLRGASITVTNRGKPKAKVKLGRRRLNVRRSDRSQKTVPEQLGGEPPRRASLAGMRREFGMRALKLEDMVR